MSAPDSDSPLDGITIVEAGSMISGPTAGRILAEFGAEIIKIERPGKGDYLRDFGPQKNGIGLWWKYLARNKKSVTLDLSSKPGQKIFEDLIRDADVLIENFRPKTLEKWNLGYESLNEINPQLVMLRMSGFGQYGPYAEQPGFGTLAEAMSGFAHLNGFEDGPPLLPPTGLADSIAGLFSTFAVMFALYHRDVHDASGQYIDTSLIEPIFNILGPQSLRYDQLGEIETRSGNRSRSSAPRNMYRTKDDRWVAISASAQPLAMRVFDAIERPELKSDNRFVDNESRLKNVEVLDAIIQDWIGDHTRERVLERFEKCDATIAPVYNIEDIIRDSHYNERDAVVRVKDDDLGEVSVPNVFPKFSESPGRIAHLGPSLGEHNEEVFRDMLGYDKELLSDLQREDVI